MTSSSVRLFVSYSHEDGVWSKRLMPVLKVKANVDQLQPWHDSHLQAGDRWDAEIRKELERMDIFLCLVSYDFLASKYITDIELPKAKERYAKGEIQVVPIVLYPMDLKDDCKFLYDLCPLPEWNKSWSEYDANGGSYKNAHIHIGNGLKQAIGRARTRLSKT